MIHLSGGSESVTKSYREYQAAWKAFLVVHHLEILEQQARPTTFSWKVGDKQTLFADLLANAPHIEQMHIATVNGRYIASAVLHEPFEGIPLLKLLERRQGADDPLGLDSIDHLVTDMDVVYELLHTAGAHITHEHNDMHAWLSLRFGKNQEYEAKFSDRLVLEVSIKELEMAVERLY